MAEKDCVLDVFIEQNRLLWSRIQTVYVFEAAIIAAWYVVWRRDTWQVGIAIGAAGTIVTFLVLLITVRDAEYVKAYLTRLQDENGLPYPSPRNTWRGGRSLLPGIVGVVLAVNIALIFLSIFWHKVAV
jgi:hypothetical protein